MAASAAMIPKNAPFPPTFGKKNASVKTPSSEP